MARSGVDRRPRASQLAASSITNAMMADDAIDSDEIVDGAVDNAHLAGTIGWDKLASGKLKTSLLVGGNEGVTPNYTLAAMAAGDEIVFVGLLTTAAAIATLADLTSRYTAGAGVLTTANNATNQTNNQLLVIWIDRT